MTAFDYGVIVIVLASLALGLWRGLIGEVLALLAWVLAALAAWQFGPEIGVLITAIADPGLRVLAGYAVVFCGVLIVLALVRLAVRGLLKALGLTAVDRLLGVFFGVARGLLIVLILVAVGGMTSAPKEPWWARAQLAPPLETAVLALKPWLPPEAAKRIRFR
ncbi:MAG: rane protein required for colicin production [Pseudomonadota bacterium]|jgi:membrane protein required for colicin V production|nr:rane protein required for colicin production [Pseudomonadota bacterium]MDQ5880472.1 rane protein required for colicin production [Pseudomonadota bacterium]MDQ5903680.1 rane protein required for colicin production [Pseudomonadota bacterium]MDQ5905748.1 rane protein required for colicin production [Pseudomonadota bacterium]MDQ5915384.1 rane protein required for colicin production [Pseudomonadota bacterium]